MVEDMQCSYWPKFGGSVDGPETFINIAKGLVDRLNAESTEGAVTPDDFTRDTFSIGFYDGVVVFEKGQILRRTAQAIGGRGLLSALKP
jgi:hypothetical protein